MIERDHRWAGLRDALVERAGRLQYEQSDDEYRVWFWDEGERHACTIWRSEVPHAVQAAGYDQAKNDADRTEFEAGYKPAGNAPLRERDAYGRPALVHVPRAGSELILVTHNFCDATTWYTESERVEAEALASADGLTWDSNHARWIDMTHGKLFDEDALAADVEHGYAVVVTVDGAQMTPRAPFASAGGDYVVDYAEGVVVFASSQAGHDVRASYSYAAGSTWVLAPSEGKRIDVEGAEVQFSTDVQLADAIVFEAWAYYPSIVEPPGKVMVERTSYKRMANYVDEALGCYPVIPAIGGAQRGTQVAIYGFPFRYGTLRALRASQGVELRCYLAGGLAFGGEHATATFYCTVRDE